MGMPKKGSRRITVDGRAFRWRLRPGPEPLAGDDSDERSGTLTFQADCDRPGTVAQTKLWWSVGESLVPEAVEVLIRRALKDGWNPDERGQAFRLVSRRLTSIPTKIGLVREVMES